MTRVASFILIGTLLICLRGKVEAQPVVPGGSGGSGSNASVGATGSAVPASSTYLGINIAGALTGLTAGQATMANSVPVVIASNQSGIPVTLAANQSVNLAQINGTSTASLMVAASTAPVTATNPALTVDLRPDSPGIITLGPATIANSVPVIPSSQYPGNATAAAVPVTATATGTTAA